MSEQDIFIAAMDRDDPAERQHYLEQACKGDPALRKRVENLIGQSGQLGSFLERPPVEAMAAESEASDEPNGEIDATVVYDNGSTHEDEGEATVPGQTMSRHPQQQDDEILLGYLQPSTQPESLGRLGHYEIQGVIGCGAFGTVLKAFDEKLHRVVAIKVLAPEMAATSPARKRFLREARSSAAVRHENVVSIYAVEDEPTPYLVMEYIPGQTLQQRLDEHGPLSLPDVLKLSKQIADGLAAAHAEQLIHRDIKPGNILLETSIGDHVKITDFGLARAADDASMTQSGMIAGTPLYMAPEQALGHKLDMRADLFSLGSVMYQMLSGRPPFRASSTVAVLKRVADDTPRPISEIIPETPEWICELIGHLHAKNPDERYGSANEVSEVLAQCVSDLEAGRKLQIPTPTQVSEGVVARPKSAIRRSDAKPLLQGSFAKVAAVVLLLLVGLGITEATGVTKFASTVFRLNTAAGTLVIETDDPSLKIDVDGEVVIISGTGIGEISLRPGQYTMTATKDGKQIKQELVTVTLDGRTVVKVGLERALANNGGPSTASGDTTTARKAPPVASAPFDADTAKAHQQAWANYLGVPVEKELILGKDHKGEELTLTMVLVPPGEFLMGTNGRDIADLIEQQKEKNPNENSLGLRMEGPQHFVKITKPFWLSKYEFKTAYFRRFVESSGYKTTAETDGIGAAKVVDGKPVRDPDLSWDMLKNYKGDYGPVVNVSHDDAMACCDWLSKQHPEMAFSLPTEAQWEFACRAGTTTPWYGSESAKELEQYGWFNSNAKWINGGGKLKPNAFGLYDMHGNVWEWCLDWASGIYGQSPSIDPVRMGKVANNRRINRGGSFLNPANYLRSAKRNMIPPENTFFDRGFRVAAAIGSLKAAEGQQDTQPTLSNRTFTSGEWIDVIPLIDPDQDATDIEGLTGNNKWSVQESELVNAFDESASKLNLPLDSDWMSYECEIEFTRNKGDRGFNLNLPNATTAVPLVFDVEGGGGLLLFRSGEKFVKRGYSITDGERTKVRVEVKRSTDGDSVKVYFQGVFAGEWTGDLNAVPGTRDRSVQNRRVSLWNNGKNEFVFHRIRVKLRDGGTAASLRTVPVKREFASGEWIDVIPLIDPELDKWDLKITGKNDWKIEQGNLLVGHGDARSKLLLFPLESDWTTFDCEVEFTRQLGENSFNLIIPTSNGPCPVLFNWVEESAVRIGGENASAVISNEAVVQTGKRTTVRLEVRRKENADHISVWRGETLLGEWTGDRKKLALGLDPENQHGQRFGLFVHGGPTRLAFHRIRVKMHDRGTATTLRPVPMVEDSSVDLIALPPVDLIALTDDTHEKVRIQNGVLSFDATIFKHILTGISHKPIPREYDLHLLVERRDKKSGVNLGILFGGQQVTVMIDGWGGRMSALETIDGNNGNSEDNPTTFKGLLFPQGERVPVTVAVRRDSIRLQVGDREIFSWTGRPDQLSVPGVWKKWGIDKDALFIGGQADFDIHKFTLTPFDRSVSEAVAPPEKPIDATPVTAPEPDGDE